MNDSNICKAMYALPDGAIVRRRKSVSTYALLLGAGFLMILFSDLDTGLLPHNISFGILSLGVLLMILSGLILFIRLAQKRGTPCLQKTGERLIRREYGFDLKDRDEILSQIERGDIQGLASRKESAVHSLIVTLYRTADNSFAAVQAFEYTDLAFQPATDIRIIRK